MELPTYHAHFYADEPAYQSMLEAIKSAMRTARHAAASDISERIRGHKISVVEYGLVDLFVTFDNGTQLQLFLSESIIGCDFVDSGHAAHPSGKQHVKVNCVLKIDGLSDPYIWDTEAVRQYVEGATVTVFGANHSAVYLDIGNAVALRVSRMFITEFGKDVLFCDVD